MAAVEAECNLKEAGAIEERIAEELRLLETIRIAPHPEHGIREFDRSRHGAEVGMRCDAAVPRR
jgi:hypothetical protein